MPMASTGVAPPPSRPLRLRPQPPSRRPFPPHFFLSLPSPALLEPDIVLLKQLNPFVPPASLIRRRCRSPPSTIASASLDSPHDPTVEVNDPLPSSPALPPSKGLTFPVETFSFQDSSTFREWDSLTAKFAGAANVPFLLLQLPQIVLNARNLLAGNKAALFAVPWLGMLTGLLGNLSLLSYFAKKKETEAVLIQTLGVLSNYVVIAQLAIAVAMPLPQFWVTSAVVAAGLLLNFFNYFGWLHDGIWQLWEDFITIGGVSVLPQVMWSTFVPYIPNSILPGLISGTVAVVAVIMARSGKLSNRGIKFVGSISGWTATLLFMWMPVAQMWTNYLHPDNIKGLSAFTMLLAMIGNGLMIPRALFIRDLMWFTGSAWATFLLGWGNLACMYCFNSISRKFFFASTLGLFLWLGPEN